MGGIIGKPKILPAVVNIDHSNHHASSQCATTHHHPMSSSSHNHFNSHAESSERSFVSFEKMSVDTSMRQNNLNGLGLSNLFTPTYALNMIEEQQSETCPSSTITSRKHNLDHSSPLPFKSQTEHSPSVQL